MRLCEKCAGVKNTCCIARDVIITPGDIKRIEEVIISKDFYEFRPVSDLEYLVQEDDPNWNIYTFFENGTRRVLKHKENNRCIFLHDMGCSLPGYVRPLVCRLHPFLYNEQGLTGISSDCPVELLDVNEDIYTSIGINTSLAETWRKELYHELFNEYNENRQSMRKAMVS
ncbi:MAG: YkgJ family cysteine cluster protein [Spirochaetales bacterium]|nr:YkgJ family cysteine cluster protein [Spirochaetales bacterium]